MLTSSSSWNCCLIPANSVGELLHLTSITPKVEAWLCEVEGNSWGILTFYLRVLSSPHSVSPTLPDRCCAVSGCLCLSTLESFLEVPEDTTISPYLELSLFFPWAYWVFPWLRIEETTESQSDGWNRCRESKNNGLAECGKPIRGGKWKRTERKGETGRQRARYWVKDKQFNSLTAWVR